MLRIFNLFSFLLLSMYLFQGCKALDPDEEIPSYLYVDTFQVNVSNPIYGSRSSKITDAYVYIDGTFWGVYELPTKLPYFSSDSTKITLRPAIKQNGISSKRIVYPFYDAHISFVNTQPLDIDTIHPTSDYTTVTSVLVNENFEAGNIFEKTGGDTTLIITTDPSEVFEGSKCAKIKLDTIHKQADFTTVSTYTLDTNSVENVYLELNYKAENNFQIYFTVLGGGISSRFYKVNITPTDKDGDGIYEWNKIYISLEDEILILRPDYFKLSILSKLDAGRTDATILIDNFKILYN